jgi:hypothetical protein
MLMRLITGGLALMAATIGASCSQGAPQVATEHAAVMEQHGAPGVGPQSSPQPDIKKDSTQRQVSQGQTTTGSCQVDTSKNDEEIDIQRQLVDLNRQLVRVGILQALALIGTLVVVGIQAAVMIQHASHLRHLASAAKSDAEAAARTATTIGEQVELMKSQNALLRDSVAAAESSAKAASDTVEMIIQRERARLHIDIGSLNLASDILGSAVCLTVHLYGTTEAMITASQARIQVSESTEFPGMAFGFPMPGLPSVISPATAPVQIEGISLYAFSEEEIRLVKAREAFVHFGGLIEYRDAFGRLRTTSCKRRWEITDLNNLDGLPIAHWVDY